MAVYPKGHKFMASFGFGASRVRKTFATLEAGGGMGGRPKRPLVRLPAPLPAAPASAPAPTPACWTLQNAFDEAHRHVWRWSKSEDKALINARQALVYFGPDTLTSEITATGIRDCVVELEDVSENSNSTCNKKMSALSVMLKQAADHCGLAPMPRMKRRPESGGRLRQYTT